METSKIIRIQFSTKTRNTTENPEILVKTKIRSSSHIVGTISQHTHPVVNLLLVYTMKWVRKPNTNTNKQNIPILAFLTVQIDRAYKINWDNEEWMNLKEFICV